MNPEKFALAVGAGGPDEEAEDKSGQQREQTDDRADHVLPAAGQEFLGQNAV